MAQNFAQAAMVAYPDGGTTARQISLTNPVVAHNSIIAIIGTFDIFQVQVTDNLGNPTYPQIGTSANGTNGNNVMSAFWIYDSLGGPCTLTMTPTSGSGFISAIVLEYTNLIQNTPDFFAHAIGNNANPACGSITNTTPYDLLLTGFCQGTTDITSATVDSSFVVRHISLGGLATQAIGVAEKISGISESPVWTIDVDTPWSAIGLSFKASAGASGVIVLDQLDGGMM
jgi:hypothetical protein